MNSGSALMTGGYGLNSVAPLPKQGLLSTLESTVGALSEALDRLNAIQSLLGNSRGADSAQLAPAVPVVPNALDRAAELLRNANRINDALTSIQNAL